jgi:hypothetical protein
MLIYIVEMMRWGENDTHHYILGAYTNYHKAKFIGNAEKSWRGGKYEYKITAVKLDESPDPSNMGYHTHCTKQRDAL